MDGYCGSSPDPPLRHLMELLADGEATLYDFVQQREVGDDADPSQLGLALSKQSILYWVAAFRLVLQLH